MMKKARMINVEVTSRVSIEISGTKIYLTRNLIGSTFFPSQSTFDVIMKEFYCAVCLYHKLYHVAFHV